MSGDLRRLHRVRQVSGGLPENHWVPWLRDMGTHGSPLTKVPEVPVKWT
jgi:hypothetical protein